ncbi:MAG: FAD-dependent oxidoreductase [Cetobacterium sp.]
MKQKVIIIGAGIGGLSAAHELSKYPDDYEITVIERNKHIGGQAAEIIKSNKNSTNYETCSKHPIKDDIDDPAKTHSALCWHAISSSYKYFLDIMDEIYDADGIKVISHLRPLSRFIYADKNMNYVEKENSFITGSYQTFYQNFTNGFNSLYKRNPPTSDMIKLYIMYLYANIICKKRVESYDSVLWSEYIESFSPEVKRWILDSTSIYLGMDYSKLSTHFMFDLFRKIAKDTKLDNKNMFYSFDGSMYNILFQPWYNQLKASGVVFLLDHEVTKIHHVDNFSTVSKITVTKKTDKNQSTKKTDDMMLNHTDFKLGVYEEHAFSSQSTKYEDQIRLDTCDYTADIIINAMDAGGISKLYPIYHRKEEVYIKFKELYFNSAQIQTQVTYYLPYRLQYSNTEPTILILHNSQWFLMVRIEGDIWSLNSSDLLSCGIGIWDKPGLNKKCAINCTREEIAKECWEQIIQTKHNLKLSKELPKWDIWDSFVYDYTTLKLQTFEPKFSNNVNTLALRPAFQDEIFTNLYHATAYTKNYTNIYNMESAAESGIKVAKIIINKTKLLKSIKFVNKKSKKTIISHDVDVDLCATDIDQIKKMEQEIHIDIKCTESPSNDILSEAFGEIESVNFEHDFCKNHKKKTKWYFRVCRKIDRLLFHKYFTKK